MDLKRYFKNKIIAVIMGGWSAEKNISRITGTAVARALRSDGFAVEEIELTHDLPRILRKKKIAFVFIALHGRYGEDGVIQGLLEIMHIPYAGSGVCASAVCMDKIVTKCVWQTHGLPTPQWWELSDITGIFFKRYLPVVVKPSSEGSAYGITIVRTKHEFKKAVQIARRYGGRVLIEKYIPGKEITVSMLGDDPLEVIEIRPRGDFYDFNSKYAPGGSTHVIPAHVPRRIRLQAQRLACAAYRVLECTVMARIDMIVNPHGRLYLLEANTIPGMTPTSLFPEASRYAGLSFIDMVKKIITLSLLKKETQHKIKEDIRGA